MVSNPTEITARHRASISVGLSPKGLCGFTQFCGGLFELQPKSENIVKKTKRLLSKLKAWQYLVIAAWLIFSIFILAAIITAIVHKNSNQNVNLSQSSQTNQQNTPLPYSSLTPANIVTTLNQQRKAKGLTDFNWITQLDNAASARANYMVANNTTDIYSGSPSEDITNAGYNDSNWLYSITWNDTSTQEAVTALTTGNNSNFGYSTSYSDIGAAVIPDTINGNSTQLIVVYLANQASGNTSTNTNPFSSSPNTRPTTIRANLNCANYTNNSYTYAKCIAATVPFSCDPADEYWTNGC